MNPDHRKRVHSPFFYARGIAIALACSIALLGFMGGCGGGNSSAPPPPSPQSVAVFISAASSGVLLGNTDQFTATVTGTSNTAVTWSVNGIAGGNSTVGTISTSGLYTAPGDLPNPASVTITATSQADCSKSANASVAITSDIALSLTVSPSGTSLLVGSSLQLAATVTTAGNPDKTVMWSVNSVPNGNSTVGTISAMGRDTATYTAPTTAPNPNGVMITATSVADPTKLTSTNLNIAAVLVNVSPPSAAAQTGDTLQFAATVVGTSDTAVTWSVNQIVGGNVDVGTISGIGLYTAPSTVPSPITISAISSANAAVTNPWQCAAGWLREPNRLLGLAGELQRDWARTEHLGEVAQVLIDHAGASGSVLMWENAAARLPHDSRALRASWQTRLSDAACCGTVSANKCHVNRR